MKEAIYRASGAHGITGNRILLWSVIRGKIDAHALFYFEVAPSWI